ncbi:BOI2 [[Candida] subhashii]|uniref:BOI2 n=1 Tax=[Candida] subhashii TaxID=561895 RepID=A0A8J5QHJ0_9ASCO|nr:BOI2 [[Candida] subhashii]KAG7662218.1 BOI2 [[Candida] subhashii]
MSGSIYICIKQFNARLGDELSLKVGDKIEVLSDDSEYNDGWYMGKNLLTNQVGLYPNTFTQLLSSPEDEDGNGLLLRARSRRIISPNKIAESVTRLSIDEDGFPHTKYGMHSEIDKAIKELEDNSSLGDRNNNNHPNGTISSNDSSISLTDDLNPLHAHDWDPRQVCSYFALVLGMNMNIAKQFLKHKITGEILFELDLTHLKELDIDSFGTRFEIYKEIEKLKEMNSRNKHKDSRRTSLSTNSTGPNMHMHSLNHNNINSLINSPPTEESSKHDMDIASSKLLPSAIISSTPPLDSPDSISPTRHAPPPIDTQNLHKYQSMDELSRPLFSPGNRDSFLSPRKAPAPPPNSGSATSSPISKPLFKFEANINGVSSDSEILEPPNGASYMTRTNASAASGLRPASSVYDLSETSSTKKSNGSNGTQQHRRTGSSTQHKRHSSLFSFLSGTNNEPTTATSTFANGSSKFPSPDKFIPDELDNFPVDIDDAVLSPMKKKAPPPPSQSAGEISPLQPPQSTAISSKRDVSNASSTITEDSIALSTISLPPLLPHAVTTPQQQSQSKLKFFRSPSTQNFRNLTGSKKSKTSAFQEGIRTITPDEAIKAANFSGWMSKRSNNNLTWRSRYFTLHGTRLSYFTSLKDKKERGLIDITAHKVVPIDPDQKTSGGDKYAAIYASSTLAGSYCFKLVPPAPGFKKGLTFTQPKTHYFAVETAEEMRGWIKALMTATIDIDDTVPVVSSCSTPTVSLAKAQELLAKAREESMLKDQELREKGYLRDHYTSNNGPTQSNQQNDSDEEKDDLSELKGLSSPTTPNVAASQGFNSPYLLASGMMSPRSSGPSPTTTPTNGYFPEFSSNGSTAGDRVTSVASTIKTNGSGGTTKKSEKFLAYSSDANGGYSFAVQQKK